MTIHAKGTFQFFMAKKTTNPENPGDLKQASLLAGSPIAGRPSTFALGLLSRLPLLDTFHN